MTAAGKMIVKIANARGANAWGTNDFGLRIRREINSYALFF